ncbi:phosphoglycerate mutase GpmB [Streptomyces sp. enrichment culture]|uniref:bifunctional RNase H/acid phosphatase n=1 Tax=Streptomyces sp. enrichment culture TaxID=1795815 RepID=UPI003F546EB2
MREFIVEADGGSRGNPGPAGYGAVVSDAATGETLRETAEYIGVATNNVAEYRGLLAGLLAARELDPDATVHVRMDSKLVIEQMSGRWKIKHPDMKPLATQASRVFPPGQVTYEWMPRAQNKHADRLANEAMDAGARGERWSEAASTAELDAAAGGAGRSAAAASPGPPGDAVAGAARVRGALAAGRAAAAPTGPGADAAPPHAPGATGPSGGGDTARTAASQAEADAETGRPGAAVRPAEAAADGRAAQAVAQGGIARAQADVRAAKAGSAAGHAVTADAPAAGAVAGGGAAKADADARAVNAEGSADGRAVKAEGPADARAVNAEGSADARAVKAEGPADGRAVTADASAAEAASDARVAKAGAPAENADADSRAAQAVAAPGWAPADMGAPATFVLLRHGETPLTPQKRFSGSGGTDPSLSGTGREQAERAAAMLARRGTIQAVVSSPLARTRETAGIVAARLGLDVGIDDGLRETDFGAWEGLTFAEVRERHPDDLNAWLASPDAEPTGGGESFAATATRLAATRDRLVAAHAGRTVLLVTHVTPIKTLVRLALGAPPESLFRMELSAASLSVVAYYADGNASVRLLNDTSHLR